MAVLKKLKEKWLVGTRGVQAPNIDHSKQRSQLERSITAESTANMMATLQQDAIAALRRDEARFRAFITASSDLVYRMSADWSELHYLQGKDFIADTLEPNRNWLEQYLHISDQPQVMAAINKAIQTKTIFQLEHRVLRTDGSFGWTFSRAVPILNDQGEIIEWLGAASDITARKQTEAALLNAHHKTDRAEKQLLFALEVGRIFVWDWDLKTGFVKRSAPAKEILGIDDSHVNEFAARVHPEDKERVQKELKDVIAGEASRDIEFRFISGSGLRWLISRGEVMHDPDGTPIRFVGVVMDITERKLARLESERQWRLYEAVLNNTPDLGYVFDLNHRFVYANEVLLKMWGKTREEAIGKTCLELGYEPWHAEMHNREIDQVAATKEPVRGEVPFTGTFGRRIYDYILVPVIGQDGTVEAVAGTTRDITDQRQALEDAQKADRKKSEFLANMSHEIRTPMNAVVGLSSLLAMDKTLSGKQKEMVATLQLSAQSLLALINNLLDITKLETKQIDLEHIAFTFGDILSEVTGVLSAKAQEKNIVFEHDVSDIEKQKFLGDPLRIRQVLTNLVDNALKFTAKGKVAIKVTATAHEKPSYSNVHISVTDSGVGIAQKNLEEIFEKFTQADASTTRKFGGTGLGLAISKNLAEIMGGSIIVKSELGQGSEFTLHVPVEQANKNAQSLAVKAQEAEVAVTSGVHGHILLVEDYKPNVFVATQLIEILGYTCDVAYNGEEAVEKIRANRNKYVAVLMDVQMPDMDGFQATKLIRADEKEQHFKRLPIIAMTAHALQGDEEKCLEAGMDEYISKPFQQGKLKEKLFAVTQEKVTS